MINAELLAQGRQHLEARAAALGQMQFLDVVPRNFTFADIRRGVERDELNEWLNPLFIRNVNPPVIYRLAANNQEGADRLRRAFADFEPQNGHRLARNNNILDSSTIYVGSSRSICQRLRQHLNTTAAATYALKMGLWCPEADYSVRVEVSGVQGDAGVLQVQDIEDALWTRSRPMFGKFGAK